MPVSRAAAATRREPQVSHDVRDLEHRPLTRGPERDVEQAIGDACVRAGETAARRLFELAVPRAAEVDGHAVHVEQLGDALDGGLECVRDGELRRRLHDHLEQCPGALELEREQPRPLAGAQRVRSADAERREPRELLRLGLLARGMEQLQDAERRPSQRKRGRDGAVLRQPRGMSTDRTGLGERALARRRAQLRDRRRRRCPTRRPEPSPSSRLSQRTAADAPVTPAARRTTSAAASSSCSATASASPASSSAGRASEETSPPAAKARRTSAAWAAQSSAASRCSAANGSPERSSSSETAVPSARPGTSRRRVAPVCSATRRTAAGARARSSSGASGSSAAGSTVP